MKKLSILTLFSLLLIISLSFVSAQDFDDDISLEDSLGVDEVDELEIDETSEELSSENTIYISPGGTGSGSSEMDSTNWNDALNKANSGDTIQFSNGNYTGINNVHQTITKSITLKGSGNSVIDAQQNGGFFSIGSSASVTLQNLSLINAYTGKHYDGPDGTDAPFNGEGGIINNGKLTIIDCLFDYNKGYGTEGGSIRNNGECNVYNTKFSRNSGAKGASIYCEENAILNIDNCVFTGGFSKKGNDIYADENAVVTIRNSTMGNAYGKSGLIVIKKSYLYMYDTYISGARSIDTAGVVNVDKESTVEIYRCTFEKNSATGGVLLFNEKNETGDGDGGAIVIEKGATSVIIKDSIFKGNSAKNRGGAIYVESSTSITLDNCTFEGNTAGRGGNNIYCFQQSSLNIRNSNFEVKSTIETSDIDYGQDELILVTVDDGTNGLLNPSYSIYTNNQEYNLRNGSLTLTGLKIGNYTAVLIGKDKNSNTYTFTQPSSLFIVGGGDLEVSATHSLNDDGSLNIFVVDQYSRPVGNKEITVVIENQQYSAVTNKEGIAVVNPDKNISEKSSVKVVVDGKTINSISNETSETLPSNKTLSIVADDLKRAYNSAYDFKVRLFDENSNPLMNKQITLVINGNDYSVSTDEYGFAYLRNTLLNGKYNVLIENPATGEQLTKSLTIVKRITGNKNLNIDYSYSGSYKIRVYADNGQPAGVGERVSIKFNGKTKNLLTDKKGYVTFKISGIKPKKYTITAEYKGVKVSNKIVIKQILKASNKSFKRYNVKKYSATLKTSKGKAIKGKKITFKIKGKTYAAKTNKKGVASIKIKGLFKLGKHKITVKYLKTSIKKTISIKK